MQPITDRATARNFIFAGNARFTIQSHATGRRFTLRVRRSKRDATLYFVGLMTGSDNEAEYSYLGVLRDGAFATTAKSLNSPLAAQAVKWFFARLASAHALPTTLALWHEGRCGCCGRALTVPTSIASGIGPECARKRTGLTLEALDA